VYRNRDEVPQRTVVIARPFQIGKHEVTRGEYAAFVAATHRAVEGNCLTDRTKRGDWVYDVNTTFRDPGFVQADNHPVACVSYDEAKAYVAWLNSKTSGGYRLLTEAEWEYVARAGAPANHAWPWGTDAAGSKFANGFDQTTMAHYAGMDTSGYKTFDPMPCVDGWLNTSPVGSLAPDKFGVYDMIGNVAEWVEDCDGPDAAAASCAKRLVKGGSWGTLAHNLRIAERVPYPATHRDDSVGIRLARTLEGN
jgi:formylglycine-generating enzyme required for sulfatase activity